MFSRCRKELRVGHPSCCGKGHCQKRREIDCRCFSAPASFARGALRARRFQFQCADRGRTCGDLAEYCRWGSSMCECVTRQQQEGQKRRCLPSALRGVSPSVGRSTRSCDDEWDRLGLDATPRVARTMRVLFSASSFHGCAMHVSTHGLGPAGKESQQD